MGLSDIDKPDYVESAIIEHDGIGRDAFLRKYGFRSSRAYQLRFNGNLYDSKAILGVAHRFAVPAAGPLRAKDFSGGAAGAARRLRQLGFEVTNGDSTAGSGRPETALVLVENEVTYDGEYDGWNDVTGVEYHFPHHYHKRVIPGTSFIYYRGVRREGGARGQAEYFGTGRIGSVWADAENSEQQSARKWSWHCSILDFVPFDKPVPATDAKGARFERISTPLGWRNGIRALEIGAFREILGEAAVPQLPGDAQPHEVDLRILSIPPLDIVEPVLVGNNSLLRRVTRRERQRSGTTPNGAIAENRRHRHARLIGARGEEIVLKLLASELTAAEMASVEHVSALGLQPGWDIQYRSGKGTLVVIEVKATSGHSFTSVEVSANEWAAAERRRGNFWLYLVTGCLGRRPIVERMPDPVLLVERNEILIAPAMWSLSRVT